MKATTRHFLVKNLLLAEDTVLDKSASANELEVAAIDNALPEDNMSPLQKVACVLAVADMIETA